MGQTMKRMAKGWTGGSDSETQEPGLKRLAIAPFVLKRRGSQYFDEDGDLAHEFYEQRHDPTTHKIRMLKCNKQNLVPQGEVQFKIPRINCELPMVLCDAKNSYR